jgi:hypothetical protein
MTIKSSGDISIVDIYNEFGFLDGDSGGSMYEYTAEGDVGGIKGYQISLSDFYGKTRDFRAINGFNILVDRADVVEGAGGTGENFMREVARVYNRTGRKGYVRVFGNVYQGSIVDQYGNPSYSSWAKIFWYQVFQYRYEAGYGYTEVRHIEICFGYYGAHLYTLPRFDFTTYMNRDDIFVMNYQGWGAYNRDRVTGGELNVYGG